MRRTRTRSLAAGGIAAAFLALPASAAATDPAGLFDAPGQSHAIVCARLAGSSAALRFGDASTTGFGVTSSLAFADRSCADGTVRLDLHETIPSSAGPLAFHRGGNGYVDGDNVKYGELATADLASALPAPTPSSGGRGAACALADEPPYRVDVRSIPEEMHYKRPQDLADGSNKGSSFVHYGDPGADQGERRGIHYSYLVWSFVNVQGGGMVRTLLGPGELVRACDVAPVTMPSWDRAGQVNGQVTARYVRVLAGSCPLYGWMVWAHTFGTAAPVVHEVASTAPAPPDPQPDPDCPAAAPASPPAVVTGDATAGADGSVVATGTVDPNGTPATYHFEFGLDAGYGAATPAAATGAADRDLPVSAALGPLAPSTTYHYRLVATTSLGTTFGDDRELTTPDPPPVQRPAEPAPPPPAPPSLTYLHLSRSSFRRARTHAGATTAIAYTLSAPATVTLSFERKVKRRWVRVRGHLTHAGGSARIRFGGWLARRPLGPGRYRVTASPAGSDGLTGIARRAGFTLRLR